MTNDDDSQWLEHALGELDEESIVWNFPGDERKRLGNPFLTGTRDFHEMAEGDLDEKLAVFRANHPEIQSSGELWEPFITDLDGRAIGAKATETLNRMIRETSYEDVVYIAGLWVHAAIARVEIGDRSDSPVRATWRTRPTRATDRPA